MEQLLKNNHVRIYTINYRNGSYEYKSDLVYDTYPSEPLNRGLRGLTGDTGQTGCEDVPSNIYEVRNPIKRAYRAYKVIIKPKHNTQESYDKIVCPFLDLDDIGVELEVYKPKVTPVRLGIKPEFSSKYDQLVESNNKTGIINGFIKEIFSQIQVASRDEYENIKTTALLHIDDVLIPHRTELEFIIAQIINDFQQYYDDFPRNDDDDFPYIYGYTKSRLLVPDIWYDYRYDVDFNDDTKLVIRCHEYTNIYKTIDTFINSLS